MCKITIQARAIYIYFSETNSSKHLNLCNNTLRNFMSMDQSQPSKRARADVTSGNFEANLFTQLGQLEKEGKMTNLKVGAPCISFLRDITKILQQSALKRLVRSKINTIIDVAYTCYQWWHQRNDLRGKWGWNISSHSTIEPCEKSCISCLYYV